MKCAEDRCSFYASRQGYCSVCYRKHYGQDEGVQDKDPELPVGWDRLSSGNCQQDQEEFFGFPRCIVVLSYEMEVHVPGAVYECRGDHFHRPPVVCIGDHAICSNNDGALSSISLTTGQVRRSRALFDHGWPLPCKWDLDPSGRFIRVDTIEQVINPITLELLDETDATDLPTSMCERALSNFIDSVNASSLPALASHTTHGSTRLWTRQLFRTDFGLVATSFDRRTRDYRIHCLPGTSVLTPHHEFEDGGAKPVFTFTSLAGEVVFNKHAELEEEISFDFWVQLAQEVGAAPASLRLVTPGGRILWEGDLRQGLTFALLQ